MEDKILEILKSEGKAITIFELEELLGTKNELSLEELTKILYQLEEDALIYHTNKDKYMILEDSHLKKGIMHANKRGFGFVDIEGDTPDIYRKDKKEANLKIEFVTRKMQEQKEEK